MNYRLRFIHYALVALISVSYAQCFADENKAEEPSQSIVVTLSKEMHVKRVKVGDKVEARTTAPLVLKDGTKLASNAKITGKVTTVNVKADKTTPSQIGILFDQVQVAKEKFEPITAIIVSIAPPAPTAGADPVAADTGQNSWGRIESMAAATGRGSASSPGAKGAGTSNRGERPFQFEPGVSFIDDINLAKFLPDGVGTLVENKKNQVYLDSKTRLLLQLK